MIDLVINWNIDPVAIEIGEMSIRWYGILYGCAFIVSGYAFSELLKFDKNLSENFTSDALLYMIVGTIVGARLGDCFFYHPLYYLQHPIEILYTWRGGLSSHGGACGILIALFLLGRKIKKPYIWVLDRVVIVIGVAGFFIRMGNLMNSEIYGFETDLPWGFVFERNFRPDEERFASHPTQIYEALYYALTYLVLRFVYRKCDNRPRPFLIFGIFLIMVFGFRFCIELIKEAQNSPTEDLMIEKIGLNMGQLLSTPFIIAGIVSLYISKQQEKPAPLPATVQQPEAVPLKNKQQQASSKQEKPNNHQQQSSNKPKKKKK